MLQYVHVDAAASADAEADADADADGANRRLLVLSFVQGGHYGSRPTGSVCPLQQPYVRHWQFHGYPYNRRRPFFRRPRVRSFCVHRVVRGPLD